MYQRIVEIPAVIELTAPKPLLRRFQPAVFLSVELSAASQRNFFATADALLAESGTCVIAPFGCARLDLRPVPNVIEPPRIVRPAAVANSASAIDQLPGASAQFKASYPGE